MNLEGNLNIVEWWKRLDSLTCDEMRYIILNHKIGQVYQRIYQISDAEMEKCVLPKSFNVPLFGFNQVGKSSLINSFFICVQDFKKYFPLAYVGRHKTSQVDCFSHYPVSPTLHFLDCPGQPYYTTQQLANIICGEADLSLTNTADIQCQPNFTIDKEYSSLCIFVMPLDRTVPSQREYKEVLRLVKTEFRKAFLVVGTKADLVENAEDKAEELFNTMDVEASSGKIISNYISGTSFCRKEEIDRSILRLLLEIIYHCELNPKYFVAPKTVPMQIKKQVSKIYKNLHENPIYYVLCVLTVIIVILSYQVLLVTREGNKK